MAKSQPKLVLAPAQGIPFNQLVLTAFLVRVVTPSMIVTIGRVQPG